MKNHTIEMNLYNANEKVCNTNVKLYNTYKIFHNTNEILVWSNDDSL